ncbi:MAG: cytochrome c [Nitrospirota bacterium]|nr:cytochrome c [Nitrospirota bacterium]
MMTLRVFSQQTVGGHIGWNMGIMIFLLLTSNITWAVENEDIQKGKVIYQESCQHCHGFAGKGDGEMASYLTPPPSNLASQTTQAKSDKELKDVIMKGREGTAMAGLEGALEESQLIDLLAYLRSLKP